MVTFYTITGAMLTSDIKSNFFVVFGIDVLLFDW